MAEGLPEADLKTMWDQLKKDWYTIYQWKHTSAVGYTERISKWIIAELNSIRLLTEGLRERDFRLADHQGQIKLQTDIEQLTEKRFVRAIYNRYNHDLEPLLGRVIDYEVPFKANAAARHGDIDLLTVDGGSVLCIEAKHPVSAPSVLKAILQAFVYTFLAQLRHGVFASEFGLSGEFKFAPAVLVGRHTAPGRQLLKREKYPSLVGLVQKLNEQLERKNVLPFRFFLIDNERDELRTCLHMVQHNGNVKKAEFVKGFKLLVSETKFPHPAPVRAAN